MSRAPWIAILGPDGSGKSSVSEGLSARLVPSPFSGVKLYHWSPGVVRLRRGPDGPVTAPHAQAPRGLIPSILKLGLLLADWLLGYWGELAQLRAQGYLVVFDRHYCDILVDPRRYRYGGPQWLARLVGRLVPSPDIVILLDAPPELIQARKLEVAPAEAARQRRAYLKLVSGLRGGTVVDASRPLSRVVADVEQVIRRWLAGHATPRAAGLGVVE